MQAAEFELQFTALGRALPHPVPEAKRGIDDELHRVDDHADSLAHHVEVVLPVVENHEQDAEREEDQHPDPERRDPRRVGA